MASVVGKTIFSDGKGKLFFGYYKTDDAVEFVDYKTWKKLSFKDVSKGDTNKQRVIKAILKNQKQFNKKVDFNMWAKKQKRSFEDTMDWFIQNGWINNINKGGIKESVDVLSVNEAMKPSQVRSTISKVKKELMRKWIQKGGYENFGQKELSQMKDKFDYNPYGSPDERQIAKMLDGFDNWAMNYDGNMREDRNSNMFYVLYQKKGVFGKPAAAGYKDRKDAEKFANSLKNHNTMILDKQSMKNVKGVDVKESVTEGQKRFKRQDGIGKAKYTISYHDGKKKHKDGSDFFDIKIFKNKKDLSDFVGSLVKQGYKLTNESVNEAPIHALSAMNATRKALEKRKVRNPKTGNDVSVTTALKDKDHPAHNQAKSLFQRIKDKLRGESVNEAKFGYKDSKASYINKHKDEYKVAEKMNNGNEKRFYDLLQQMEDKVGHPKTMLFISNALRGYKVDMYKDPKIKNPQDAQEALFLLSK